MASNTQIIAFLCSIPIVGMVFAFLAIKTADVRSDSYFWVMGSLITWPLLGGTVVCLLAMVMLS